MHLNRRKLFSYVVNIQLDVDTLNFQISSTFKKLVKWLAIFDDGDWLRIVYGGRKYSLGMTYAYFTLLVENTFAVTGIYILKM